MSGGSLRRQGGSKTPCSWLYSAVFLNPVYVVIGKIPGTFSHDNSQAQMAAGLLFYAQMGKMSKKRGLKDLEPMSSL